MNRATTTFQISQSGRVRKSCVSASRQNLSKEKGFCRAKAHALTPLDFRKATKPNYVVEPVLSRYIDVVDPLNTTPATTGDLLVLVKTAYERI